MHYHRPHPPPVSEMFAARATSLVTRRAFSTPSPTQPSNIRLRNLATASFCFTFVVSVFYYSAIKVQGGDGDISELEGLENERKINVHQSGELKVSRTK
jgi:hypothetical protein